jgi:hypothetical protein
MSLVDDEEVVGGRRQQQLLVLCPAGQVAGGEQERVLFVRVEVRPDWSDVVWVRAVDVPALQARHPQAELLEQLVLPLAGHIGGRQDQRPTHLTGKDEPAQRHAGRDRLAEADLVGHQP